MDGWNILYFIHRSMNNAALKSQNGKHCDSDVLQPFACPEGLLQLLASQPLMTRLVDFVIIFLSLGLLLTYRFPLYAWMLWMPWML